MISAVDHIVAPVDELTGACETFERLGFYVSRRVDPIADRAYLSFDDFYLELRGPDAHQLPTGIEVEGLRELVLRSADLDADVARIRTAGFAVTGPFDDPLDGAGGSLARRTVAVDVDTPVFLTQNDHAAADRHAFLGSPASHPNTATALERTYVAVKSIEHDLADFEKVFGLPAPEPEMGTVIMSSMSVFYLGDIGVAIAEPRGPGPTAEALAAGGRGPFQILFRAQHLDVAHELMIANGVPEPERGTRLSGESALLVLPGNACGVYVGLAGRA